MSRRYISQLGEREAIDQVFLVSDKQLRANRQGNLYLQLRLTDRTGSISGMFWNANEKQYAAIESGGYLRIKGTAQVHHGALQIIVTHFERFTGPVDESEFVPLSPNQIDAMARRVAELLRSIRNFPLRNLAECFLVDEAFQAKFHAAPAGIKHHHAYRGGLLEHVLNMMELVLLVAPRYPEVDRDLLLMGTFLHDIGKIDELAYQREFGYTDEGQMIGHLVMGCGIVDAKVREAEKLAGEPFPPDLAVQLKHMVVSHHGEYQQGSPKLPMTLEALVLYLLDTLDAKVHAFSQLIRSDANNESRWTVFHQNLGRKLYKGNLAGPTD